MSELKRTPYLGIAVLILGLMTDVPLGVAQPQGREANPNKKLPQPEPPAAQAGQGESSPSPAQTSKAPLLFGLKDGTPVKLRLSRTISSADAKVGERVDFGVLEEIKVSDVVVIPKGSIAWGTVTEARRRGIAFRGGKLNVNIKAVILADGEKADLRATREFKGDSQGGAMAGAMAVTGVVFWPALPLWLFTPGKNIEIPKGTEILAYINGDVPVDSKKFATRPVTETPAPPPVAPAATQPAAQEPAPATLSPGEDIVIKSTPSGADITVDGKLIGTTPFTLRLALGEHTISIEKPGFKTWQRTMTVSAGGSVNVDATLEKTL